MKYLCLLLALTGCLSLSAQNSDKEKAHDMLLEAVEMMDKGQIDASIEKLIAAKKMDPENFAFDYEIGFAYQMKKDYVKAIVYFDAATKYKNAIDACYQMLGNCYDLGGDSKKAIATYEEGLKIFPNSGKLYLELGVMALIAEDYDKAVLQWEKAIKVNPTYASPYFRLSDLFSNSSQRIWSIFYGEMFRIIEPGSERSEALSKTLFEAYRKSIEFKSDLSAKVDFAPSEIKVDPSKKFKLPFDQVYGLDFIFCMTPSLIRGNKECTIAFLHETRSALVDRWFEQKRDKEYHNVIFDFQKKVKDNGHLEAYNYWLFMNGNEAEFEKWYTDNKDKFVAFVDWFRTNRPVIDTNHYFLRTEID